MRVSRYRPDSEDAGQERQTIAIRKGVVEK